MSIKRVVIEGTYKLEGVLNENSKRGGVIICHPHPIYGGDMHNNVVSAIEGALPEWIYNAKVQLPRRRGKTGFYGNGSCEAETLWRGRVPQRSNWQRR